MGRPPHDWIPIARAVVAKAVLNLDTTRALIARLHLDEILREMMGWTQGRTLPHESASSRVFEQLARTDRPRRSHEALKQRFVKDRGTLSRRVWLNLPSRSSNPRKEGAA